MMKILKLKYVSLLKKIQHGNSLLLLIMTSKIVLFHFKVAYDYSIYAKKSDTDLRLLFSYLDLNAFFRNA